MIKIKNHLQNSLIANKAIKLQPWIIWFTASLFFFFEYVVRVSPSVMSVDIMHEFKINALEFGLLSVFFYYAYIAMQLPVGVLVDHLSVRRLLFLMVLLCAISCFFFAFSTYFDLLKLARLLIGISGAFAFVGALKLATAWFPPSRFGFLAGATQAFGMLGAAVGEGPLSVVVEHHGWRSAYFLLGILLVLLSFAVILIIRNRPKAYEETATPVSYQKMLAGFLQVIKNPLIWVNGIFVGLLYAPTGAFGELWGTLYMRRVYHFSAVDAATVISIIFIGWGIGSPIFGWFSDYIGRRKIVMLISAFFSLIFLSVLLYFPHLFLKGAFIIAFLYGFFNVGVSVSYAYACDVAPKNLSGVALGFTNMASIIIGAAFQPLIGYLLVLQEPLVTTGTLYSYSIHDFQRAMFILPVTLFICLILGVFLKERKNSKVPYAQSTKMQKHLDSYKSKIFLSLDFNIVK